MNISNLLNVWVYFFLWQDCISLIFIASHLFNAHEFLNQNIILQRVILEGQIKVKKNLCTPMQFKDLPQCLRHEIGFLLNWKTRMVSP